MAAVRKKSRRFMGLSATLYTFFARGHIRCASYLVSYTVSVYNGRCVIQSFADATTRDIFDGANTKPARGIDKALWPVICRKFDMLNGATAIQDLRVPPGNHLEALKGDQRTRWSIRVNRQYRITFQFTDGHAYDVRCEDYH